MAKDLFHDCVKEALIKDGWNITDDPYELRVGMLKCTLIWQQSRLSQLKKKI